MIPRVMHVVGRTVLRISFTVLLIFLVVLALYVSLGRQFAPMVSNYADEIEQRLSVALSASVQLRHIEGEWARFSPRFVVHDLQLRESPDDAPSLQLDRVTLSPDIPASLLQRRLVMGSTRIESLQLNLIQTEAGWGLAGLAGAEAGDVALTQVFEWIKSLVMLELEDSRIVLQPLAGPALLLEQASIRLQSLADRHVVTAVARLEGSQDPVHLQAELFGADIANIHGEVFLSVPVIDVAGVLHGTALAGIVADRLSVQGDFWLDIESGRFRSMTGSAVGSGVLSRVGEAFPVSDSQIAINELGADWFELTHDADANHWQLQLEGLAFALQEADWPTGGVRLDYNVDNHLGFHADAVDLGVLARIAEALLPEGGLKDEIVAINPRGRLSDVIVSADLPEGVPSRATLLTNLQDTAISAHRGAPSLWGVNGYAELSVDAYERSAEGFIEVDSEDLMMHLPALFNDIWQYDKINGRIGFHIDAAEDINVRLASSVIEAQSEVLTGRGQFSTEIQTGADRFINLELIVGALDADVSRKSLYLPTAPTAPAGIQGVLSWINGAVLAGEGRGSGLIFRGRVQRGAMFQERTLQMFYRVADGTFRFDPAWPVLEALDGYVTIDNGEVDVAASTGRSLGINFNSSVASVRANPGGGRWLSVSGAGRGSAQQGLQYLQQTPVTQGLGQNLASWEAQGDAEFGLQLSIPLLVPDASPEIRLELGFTDNELYMPEYDLRATELSGNLVYSAADGLQSEGMHAFVLGHHAEVDIRGDGLRGEPLGTRVTVSGEVPFTELAAWQGMPWMVATLLEPIDGQAAYTAELQLPVYGQSPGSGLVTHPRLAVRSDLLGAQMNLPAPFFKKAEDSQALELILNFGPESFTVNLSLEDVVQTELNLVNGTVQSGLVYFGPRSEGLRVRRLNAGMPGVEVLGQIPELNYIEWSELIGPILFPGDLETPASEGALAIASAPSPASAPASRVPGLSGAVEIAIDRFNVMDEIFEQVSLQLVRQSDGWAANVVSEAVTGRIHIPDDPVMPLQVDIEHLHLTRSLAQDDDENRSQDQPDIDPQTEIILDLQELPTVEYLLPRSDPLVALDPRNFPDIRLSLGQLTLAGSDFGRWQFSLQSDESGAYFTDLQVNSRGLQIGSETEPGEFRWIYDGNVHRSVLNSTIFATDLGPVLSAYGYAPSIQSAAARFDARLHWDGSPAYFSALGLNGDIDLMINNGRFQQRAGVANSALRLISIINFDAVIRRLRFSDDLARAGLAYDEIRGRVALHDGIVTIDDRLHIAGPSSLFQITGEVNLAEETIDADLFITLPVSDNIPWLGGLAVLNNLINWQVALGVFLFDRIFGDQVESLTSAHYTLKGPWEGLEPRLYQVFTGGS
jgi:uncharacterized protein (TIGR02099 family)